MRIKSGPSWIYFLRECENPSKSIYRTNTVAQACPLIFVLLYFPEKNSNFLNVLNVLLSFEEIYHICICTHIHVYTHIFIYVCNKVCVSKMKYYLVTSWDAGEISYPARSQNQSRGRHPKLASHTGSGGAVTPRQLWLAWVVPEGTMPSPTWTKATPRELIPDK